VLSPETLERAAIAAALAAEKAAGAARTVLSSLPSGWRMSAMPPERRSYTTPAGDELTVSYRRRRDGRYDCTVTPGPPALGADGPGGEGEGGGRTVVAERYAMAGGAHDLSIDGLRVKATVVADGPSRFVDFASGESVELAERPRFPEAAPAEALGALVAPMPGNVLSVHVAVGDEVTAGQLLVVVEAMKMEHRLTAPASGTVRELHAKPGEQVSSGDLLVALDHDDAQQEEAP
jgi:propionyl-CoA carboxylase alpha chain